MEAEPAPSASDRSWWRSQIGADQLLLSEQCKDCPERALKEGIAEGMGLLREFVR